VYLHGIRDDDRDRSWLDALDRSFRRAGVEGVEARFDEVLAPSYLDLLESEVFPKVDDAPSSTYVKGSDGDYDEAAARYWMLLGELERTGIRGPIRRARFPTAPQGDEVRPFIALLYRQAWRYCKSSDRRDAVLARVVKQLAADSDLVILAHSLGSLVALDLLYLLPSGCRVEMLVTFGSPLAIKPVSEHLSRRRHRFPYEVVGPWINVSDTSDVATGLRGVSKHYPEGLDVFTDSQRSVRRAHAATSYLDGDTVPTALKWLEDRCLPVPDPSRPLPDLLLPEGLLSVIVGAQFALRVEQAMKPGESRTRFSQARAMTVDAIVAELRSAGIHHPVLNRLHLDSDEFLRGRVKPREALQMLVTATMSNPIAPYEIKVPDGCISAALANVASDLGVASRWAQAVERALRDARDCHGAGWNWKRTALAVAGGAAVVAAPMAVLVAAPAGLAGGAAIVGGLAALGPGGMLGGIGIVGLIGGAGGALAGQALVAGTAAEVAETVVFLQTLAAAGRDLGQPSSGNPCWAALVAMEDVLTDDLARQKLFSDDGTHAIRDVESKLKSVQRAMDWMVKRDLGPKVLEEPEG
jgi:hypothetical protein